MEVRFGPVGIRFGHAEFEVSVIWADMPSRL